MSNTLKYILLGVAGVVIGFLATIIFSSPKIVNVPVGGNTNYGGSLTVEDLTTAANPTTGSTGMITTAGGITNNTATSTENGVSFISLRQSMASATSTLCALFLGNATTTNMGFDATITTATSSAVQYVLSTSTTPYGPSILGGALASTSLLATGIIPANSTQFFHYVPPILSTNGLAITPTTMNATSSTAINGPNTYLVLYAIGGGIVQGGSGTVNAGICTAFARTTN